MAIKKKLQALEELKAEFQSKGKDILMGSIKEFFELHPEALEVAWTQYTQYFNDGEPCTFEVYEPWLKVKPSVLEEDVRAALLENCEDEEGGIDGELSYVTDVYEIMRRCTTSSKYDGIKRAPTTEETKLMDDFKDLKGVLQGSDDVMNMTFGDHVKVTASRSGFETAEYEHD